MSETAPSRPSELAEFLLHLEKERDVSPHTLTDRKSVV